MDGSLRGGAGPSLVPTAQWFSAGSQQPKHTSGLAVLGQAPSWCHQATLVQASLSFCHMRRWSRGAAATLGDSPASLVLL